MNIWPFHKPERSTTAELRDRLIEAETTVVFLANELEHARRPRREPRKDKGSIAAAYAATHQRLRAEIGVSR